MTADTLMHYARDSGGVLYVIAAMLFVALTVILERSWFLQRLGASGRTALAQLDRLDRVDAGALSNLAARHANLPTGRVLALAARLSGQRNREQIAAQLDEMILREAPGIDRFLWVLDTIVTLAPLLGLFGTIVGMFHAFQVLSDPGNAPTQVTGGVAEALVATASGLFVAMIGLLFFNGLHNRVRLAAHQLETLKAALVNRLSGAAHEPAATAHSGAASVAALASQGA
ncbi:MotA/TolQ/ExbB proton channel family protein [Paraburkholderia acidisoli]|uniref:MotA/TolQ/ExbB proton channel family protein n=1 Tax=Paraburkholderia acidisoli TaxID=2571748 RepID=A0A7Z2GQD8_9BURK|nr:MotA/TolQ/ExbB proton channel family protein [Paraburkholderia acidisoli]QGZ65659.1 MotA/TolQ/ExbB proton channel family protein [Paraburkholderia acidisoli]